EGLAACNSQTTSPFGCLNNFCFQILSNFWGSLQRGQLFVFSAEKSPPGTKIWKNRRTAGAFPLPGTGAEAVFPAFSGRGRSIYAREGAGPQGVPSRTNLRTAWAKPS